MIVFSAITPHPPIIVPGIGRGADLEAVAPTIAAMEKLAKSFEATAPDTVVVISPHAPLEAKAFAINVNKELSGNLFDFGLSKEFKFENDLATAESIKEAMDANEVPLFFHEEALDHGTLVPLYYLADKLQPRLISLSFSLESLRDHYRYGQLLGEVFKSSPKKIAVIASGDLSHRLLPGAPAGYDPKGKEFDRELIRLLGSKDTEDILNLDEDLIERAGECGLRSLVILLGILNGHYVFKALDYEGPFGVGYLVAEL